jgi:hypothetical protein
MDRGRDGKDLNRVSRLRPPTPPYAQIPHTAVREVALTRFDTRDRAPARRRLIAHENIKLARFTRSVDDASSRSASRDNSVTTDMQTEYDNPRAVEVPADRFWGALTQRSREPSASGKT